MFLAVVKKPFYYITRKVLILSWVKLYVGGFSLSVRRFYYPFRFSFSTLRKAHKMFFVFVMNIWNLFSIQQWKINVGESKTNMTYAFHICLSSICAIFCKPSSSRMEGVFASVISSIWILIESSRSVHIFFGLFLLWEKVLKTKFYGNRYWCVCVDITSTFLFGFWKRCIEL